MIDNRFFYLALFLLIIRAPTAVAATDSAHFGSFDQQPKAAATLVSAFETIALDQKSYVGLHLVMQPEWHTYWLNPGDSGLPTQIKWLDVPKGVELGNIQWPLPIVFVVDDQVNYGYSHEVTLLVPIVIRAPYQAPGVLELQGIASWLSCREACIREQQQVSTKIVVGTTLNTAPSASHPLVRKALDKLPSDDLASILGKLKISWGESNMIDFHVANNLVADKAIDKVLVLSNEESILQPTPPLTSSVKQNWRVISVALSDYLTTKPTTLSGVVILYFRDETSQGFSFNNVQIMERTNE